MPRLNNEHYIWRHNFLTVIAQREPTLLLAFTAQQQWQLHRYYATGLELTASELTHYRAALHRSNPSLGARAGKPFCQLLRLFDLVCELYGEDAVDEGWAISDFMRERLFQPGDPGQRLFVLPLVRPQPDLHKLALAFISLAQKQLEAEQEQQDQGESDVA